MQACAIFMFSSTDIGLMKGQFAAILWCIFCSLSSILWSLLICCIFIPSCFRFFFLKWLPYSTDLFHCAFNEFVFHFHNLFDSNGIILNNVWYLWAKRFIFFAHLYLNFYWTLKLIDVSRYCELKPIDKLK